MEGPSTNKTPLIAQKIRSVSQQENKLNAETEGGVGNCVADFKIISELGRGSYGLVNKVISNVDNRVYVMKKINIKHVKQKHQKEALKEAQILRKVRHQNIIKYYTSFVEDEHLYIVMEYAEGGDLQMLIKQRREKKQPFTEKEIWVFAWELCQAVDYLHNNNIIHRDIKTLNIFLTKDQQIKLGDLGVSKIVSSAASLQGTRVGTPLYLSPELVKQQPYDIKVDIWAVGCVLYHLGGLEPPFYGENLISLGYNIVHKQPKPLAMYSPRLTTLISKFLEKNPSYRPKISDVLEVFPSKLRKAKFQGPQLEHALNNERKEEVIEKIEESIRVESETDKAPKSLSSKPQTLNNVGSDQIRVIRAIETKPIKETTGPDPKPNELDEAMINNKMEAHGKRNIVEPSSKIASIAKFEELKSSNEKMDEQEKARSLAKAQARVSNEDPSALVVRNRENELKQQSNEKQQLVTKSTELNQSMRLTAKQTSSAKKPQEKINEAETTSEAKPRLVNNRNDLQGNESTLSVKKSELTNAQNLSSKEEIQQKRSIKDKKTEHVIPEEAHDQVADQPADLNRRKGTEVHLSKKLKQTIANEKSEEAKSKAAINVSEQKAMQAKISEFKKVMMNPLINSSSPRMSLANTKFSRIISLRNETNLNIMRGNFAKRDPSTDNLQADYRPRPVSAQVGKRPQWDGNKGYQGGKLDSLLGFDSYENDIYEDKDEKEVYELLEQFDQNRGAFNRPKSAMVYSRAPAITREEPIKNVNDYVPDTQIQNIKLKDLLSQNSSPRNFPTELRALDQLKQGAFVTRNQGVEPKFIVSQASQEKLLSSNQNSSSQNKGKAKVPDYDVQGSLDLRNQSEWSRDMPPVNISAQPKYSEILNKDNVDNPFQIKPLAQSSIGFFKPGVKPNDTTVQTKARDNPSSKTNPTAQTNSESYSTNPTRVSAAIEKESFKIRPVTSSGARKKYTIKDLEL